MLPRKLQHAFIVILILGAVGVEICRVEDSPCRVLLDTDMDTDDIFALLYLLKLNRTELDLEAIIVNSNGWSNSGHAVDQIYDILYMMGRDDISVGVGGEGGILDDGTIRPNVGGYLSIIEQGLTTVGGCRYRQAIPIGKGGRLNIDTNFGVRKEFLPQGRRQYSPLGQPTAQQVLIDKISAGPITLMLTGAHTNIAIFLMSNPHLKKNVEHIYIMGGSIGLKNPISSCLKGPNSSCTQEQDHEPGNLFTTFSTNPYAEFNFFEDPFAAYQVIHSGIPVTLVPLDATNTIPITKDFLNMFEQRQSTYEAQYCFKSLKMAHDVILESEFYSQYFLWDSFMAGVAASIIRNPDNSDSANKFAEMEYMNITVITSNKPLGISDSSNPFFNGREVPKFRLRKGGVHSGHVQTGIRDPFCMTKNYNGKCKDGYTEKVSGAEGVRILVAKRAKPSEDTRSRLNREFYKSLLDVLNHPQQSGKFNFTTQFPNYKEVLYKPSLGTDKLGKPVIFDMDMSAGDFLALLYLLKVPVEKINLKAIIVSPTGWANAATIDVIYNLLHMMGRDDIPVGMGDAFAMNQSDPFYPLVGDCKYVKAIPHGRGGFLDSDTLYGLSRNLPRSPRRYTEEILNKNGAPGDTKRHEQRQPLALEIWDNVTKSLDVGSKVTILTNGPLTSLAKIISSVKAATSLIEDVFIVGGHISHGKIDKGNVFTVPSNEYAEFNMFLDPLAAKTVFQAELNITLIPLGVQRRVCSFSDILKRLRKENTPEALFAARLVSRLDRYKRQHHRYQHMDTFLGEVLGAVILAGDHSLLNTTSQVKPIKVFADGEVSKDGQIATDIKGGRLVKVIENVMSSAVYDMFAEQLGNLNQSAVVGSFNEQARMWGDQPSVSSL